LPAKASERKKGWVKGRAKNEPNIERGEGFLNTMEMGVAK
jgi:hypothetical protein